LFGRVVDVVEVGEVVEVVDVADVVVVIGIVVVVVVVEGLDVVVVVRRGLLATPWLCDSLVLRIAPQAADPFRGLAQLWTRAGTADPPAATEVVRVPYATRVTSKVPTLSVATLPSSRETRRMSLFTPPQLQIRPIRPVTLAEKEARD
jgi:hypothetical protein